MCTHQGYPLVGLPGANVFFTDEDLTNADGSITCKKVDWAQAGYDVVKAARYLTKLAELL